MFVKAAFISDKLAYKLNVCLAKRNINNMNNNLIFQLKVIWENKVHKTTGCLSVAVEVIHV